MLKPFINQTQTRIQVYSSKKLRLPLKRKRPIKLTKRPNIPTKIIKDGRWISSGLKNLFKDSTKIEKQSAHKNTALTSAPKTSALAQPNVFLDHFLGDMRTEIKAITSATTSESIWKESATKAIELVI